MSLPEQETPERNTAEERIYRKIMDVASNVAVRRKNLPPKVHVLILDETTGEKVAAFLNVRYIGDSGMANITLISAGVLPTEETVEEAADILLKSMPGMPMICDKEIADELNKSSLVWVEEDHYRLEGRQNGVLEIFTPYGAINLPEAGLPQDVKSIQIFTE